MNREEMRKFVWGQVLLLTAEKKNKFRDGKYAAYKEMWEKLGGDSGATVHMDENASEESKRAMGRMIEVAMKTYKE